MSTLDRVRGWLGLGPTVPRVRVHVIVRGRIGEGWMDIDRHFSLPEGATLGDLLLAARDAGIDLEAAIAQSPHLASTLMWNGERRALDEHRDRKLANDDQIYLLAPLAGG